MFRVHGEQTLHAIHSGGQRPSGVHAGVVSLRHELARESLASHSGILILLVCIQDGLNSELVQHTAFLTLALHPALLLIDFGHFQYNSVMLGRFFFRSGSPDISLGTQDSLYLRSTSLPPIMICWERYVSPLVLVSSKWLCIMLPLSGRI